jgi:hypothetical protein
MRTGHDTPKTLLEAVKYYADFEHCKAVMIEARWPDGIVRCRTCGSDHVTYMAKTRRWKCYGKHLRPQFSLKVGTIFEDSPLGLDKWLVAVWLMADSKNGISSYELGRALGVTQKTAWFMLHRVRKAMQAGTFLKLDGEVEVDESFIGGKDKAMVMGTAQRGGEVRAMVVPDRRKRTLHAQVEEHVQAGAALYSDDLRSYDGLAGRYAHQVVDHAVDTLTVGFTRTLLRTSGACSSAAFMAPTSASSRSIFTATLTTRPLGITTGRWTTLDAFTRSCDRSLTSGSPMTS